MIERTVARIAAGTELIEGDDEVIAIFGVDRFFQFGHRVTYVLLRDIVAKKLSDVIEAFLEPVDLVISKRPIAGSAGKPKLDVPHLLLRHDPTEVEEIRRLLRRWIGLLGTLLRAGRRSGERDRRDKCGSDRRHQTLLDHAISSLPAEAFRCRLSHAPLGRLGRAPGRLL